MSGPLKRKELNKMDCTDLETFKKNIIEQKLPKPKHISVDCVKCGKTMFEICLDQIRGPVNMICDKCRGIE